MKKMVAILTMLAMVFMMMTAAFAAEDIVRNEYGSTVQGWMEEWAEKYGYEQYTNQYGIDSNGVWRGFGVIDADAFEELYGIPVTEESLIDKAHEVSDNKVEIEIWKVGEYEGFNIKIMKCWSPNKDYVVGLDYRGGVEIPYYSGEMLYMVYSRK